MEVLYSRNRKPCRFYIENGQVILFQEGETGGNHDHYKHIHPQSGDFTTFVKHELDCMAKDSQTRGIFRLIAMLMEPSSPMSQTCLEIANRNNIAI